MKQDQHDKTRNQVLALAGTAQFIQYAHEMATDGTDRADRFDRAVQAILCTDPDTAMDVFGDQDGVADGVRYVQTHLAGRRPDTTDARIARYMGQVLKLSGKLLDDEQALGRIQGAIDRAGRLETGRVAAIFNEVYQETISQMQPRIMLQGHPTWLENEAMQQRIRTHLMAAIRCGVMWRQCGGGFFTLFLRRKALLSALDE